MSSASSNSSGITNNNNYSASYPSQYSSTSMGRAFDDSVALTKDFLRHIESNNNSKHNKTTVVVDSAHISRVPGRNGLALGAATLTKKEKPGSRSTTITKEVFGIFQPTSSTDNNHHNVLLGEEFHIPDLLARKCYPLDVVNSSSSSNKNDLVSLVETDAEERFLIIEKRVDDQDENAVVTVKRVRFSENNSQEDSSRNEIVKRFFTNNSDHQREGADSTSVSSPTNFILIGGTFPHNIVFVTNESVFIFEEDKSRQNEDDDEENVCYLKLVDPSKIQEDSSNKLATFNKSSSSSSDLHSHQQTQFIISGIATADQSSIVLLVGTKKCAETKEGAKLYLIESGDGNNKSSSTSSSFSCVIKHIPFQGDLTQKTANLLLGGCSALGLGCMSIEQLILPNNSGNQEEKSMFTNRKLFILLSEPKRFSKISNNSDDNNSADNNQNENENESNNSINNDQKESSSSSPSNRIYFKPSGMIAVCFMKKKKKEDEDENENEEETDEDVDPIIRRIAILKDLDEDENDSSNNEDSAAVVPSPSHHQSPSSSSLLQSSLRPLIVPRFVSGTICPCDRWNSPQDQIKDDSAIFVDSYHYDGETDQLLYSCRPFSVGAGVGGEQLDIQACQRIIKGGPTNVPFTLPNFTDADFFIPFCQSHHQLNESHYQQVDDYSRYRTVSAGSVAAIDFLGNMSIVGASGDWRTTMNNNMDPISNTGTDTAAHKTSNDDDAQRAPRPNLTCSSISTTTGDPERNKYRKPISISFHHSSIPHFEPSLFSRVLRSVENFRKKYLWICETSNGGGVSLAKIVSRPPNAIVVGGNSYVHDNPSEAAWTTEDLASNFTSMTFSDAAAKPSLSIFNRICSVSSLSHARNITVKPAPSTSSSEIKNINNNKLAPSTRQRNDSSSENNKYNNSLYDDEDSSLMFMTKTASTSFLNSKAPTQSTSVMTNSNNNTATNNTTSSSSPILVSSSEDSVLGIVSGALVTNLDTNVTHQQHGAVLVDFQHEGGKEDEDEEEADEEGSIHNHNNDNNIGPQIISNIIPLDSLRPRCSLCLRTTTNGENNNNSNSNDNILFVAGGVGGLAFSLLSRQDGDDKNSDNQKVLQDDGNNNNDNNNSSSIKNFYSSSFKTVFFSILGAPVISVFHTFSSSATSSSSVVMNRSSNSSNNYHHGPPYQIIWALQRDGTLTRLKVTTSGNIGITRDLKTNILITNNNNINETNNNTNTNISNGSTPPPLFITSCKIDYNKKDKNQKSALLSNLLTVFVSREGRSAEAPQVRTVMLPQ